MSASAMALVTMTLVTIGDWTQWRGPDGTGVSAETEWGSQGKELWRRQVGLGYSGVAVIGGRVMTTGHDVAAEQDTVYCFDARTGEQRWAFSFPAKRWDEHHEGGTHCTPAADENAVYVVNREGNAFCLGRQDGTVRWRRNYARELDVPIPSYGMAGSPLVVADHLFVSVSGVTAAVRKQDGSVQWRVGDASQSSYSTPAMFAWERRPCLAIFHSIGLWVVDRQTGQILRRHDWPVLRGGVHVATPVVTPRGIFISAGSNQGCQMVDVRSESCAVAWENKRMRNHMNGCVLIDDHLYGFDESILKCMDLSGREKWRKRGLGLGVLSGAGDRLILLSSRGELIVAQADSTRYHEQSRAKLMTAGVCWTAPAIANGLIYCRSSRGELVCRDHRRSSDSVADSAPPKSDSPEALPPAATLFARHITAVGGEEAIRRHPSMILTGTVENRAVGMAPHKLTIEKLAPNQMLTSFVQPQLGIVQECFDGTHAWKIRPGREDILLQGAALREMREEAGYDRDLTFRQRYPSATTVGREFFAGLECYVVQATTSGGRQRQLYFDVARGRYRGRDAVDESMVVLSEYREFDGRWLPTRWEIHSPDTGAERSIVIKNVVFDPVDPARFHAPEAIRWQWMTPAEVAEAQARADQRYAEYLGHFIADEGPFRGRPCRVITFRGQLTLDVPGQQTYGLEPPDEEGWRKVEQSHAIAVRFRRDAGGNVIALDIDVAGHRQRLERQRPESPAPPE